MQSTGWRGEFDVRSMLGTINGQGSFSNSKVVADEESLPIGLLWAATTNSGCEAEGAMLRIRRLPAINFQGAA